MPDISIPQKQKGGIDTYLRQIQTSIHLSHGLYKQSALSDFPSASDIWILLTLVAPFIAVAICSLLLSVCIRNDTACSCTLICVNFWIYLRVRTRSLARILQAFYSTIPLYQPSL